MEETLMNPEPTTINSPPETAQEKSHEITEVTKPKNLKRVLAGRQGAQAKAKLKKLKENPTEKNLKERSVIQKPETQENSKNMYLIAGSGVLVASITGIWYYFSNRSSASNTPENLSSENSNNMHVPNHILNTKNFYDRTFE